MQGGDWRVSLAFPLPVNGLALTHYQLLAVCSYGATTHRDNQKLPGRGIVFRSFAIASDAGSVSSRESHIVRID